MSKKLFALAVLLLACEPVTAGPTMYQLGCHGVGCEPRTGYETADTVGLCDESPESAVERAEAICGEYVATAPSCFLDVFCEGDRPLACECEIIHEQRVEACEVAE